MGLAQWVRSAVVWAIAPIACGWLWLARRRYQRRARPLTEGERAAVGEYFSQEVCDGVRVAVVERIELPLVRLARMVSGRANPMHSPGGIALGKLVVVAAGPRRGEREFRSTLFHELVHVEQYRVLGEFGFLRLYLGAVICDGCGYLEIPLEEQAYGLQEKFERGELKVGEVERDVRELARRK